MKLKLILAITLSVMGPSIASASTFILDTGTPPTTTAKYILSAVDWYAAEFSVTKGETITQLSAYLTQGSGEPGNTFTFDIYSASGTFLGRNRENPSFTATGTFSANGWNSVAVDWVAPTTGLYWIALQVSGASQTPGLDLPAESSDSSGTAPALAFADATSSSHQFAIETAAPFGIEISATPLPAALPLFVAGLGVIGLMAGRRKRKAASLAA